TDTAGSISCASPKRYPSHGIGSRAQAVSIAVAVDDARGIGRLWANGGGVVEKGLNRSNVAVRGRYRVVDGCGATPKVAEIGELILVAVAVQDGDIFAGHID